MSIILRGCMIVKRIINKLSNKFYILCLQSRISGAKGIICQGHKNITIGQKCSIGRNSWLAALPLTGANECHLIIGDGSYIGNFAHIYATQSIEIKNDVLIADRVYISDNAHEYRNINVPIIKQPIIQKKNVVIGDGSWLGENVCVIGASIGKHCVIGANSVVTHDIPDYSLAVGSPAKVIKKYNPTNNDWESMN